MGQAVGFLNEYVFGVGIPVFLIIVGIFLCIKLSFFHFLHPIKVIKGLLSGNKGDGVSSAKALSLSLAGTLGVGNMVGVASAIALGGFGAVFWMWISALVAMIVKYAEIVIAILHRRYDKEGRPYGAAMYYISDCFKGRRLGKILAGVFGIFLLVNAFSVGSMIQVNAAAEAMRGVFGVTPIVIGVIFAIITFYAMWRGVSGVLGFTEKLVPLMTVGFIVLSLAVICLSPKEAWNAIKAIFDNAFTVRSGFSGVGGFLLSHALRYGTMRGIISNEAGCGTAPAAHAVANCRYPAEQGLWGIFEVFVDTILLCTLTAVCIIVGFKGTAGSEGDYMMMTVNAYRWVLGDIAGYFLSVAVLLFGLATVLCWGHYAMESVKYFSQSGRARRLVVVLYSVFVLLGSVVSADFIWEAADLAIGFMTVINLSVIMIMNGAVKKETELYFDNIKTKKKKRSNII